MLPSRAKLSYQSLVLSLNLFCQTLTFILLILNVFNLISEEEGCLWQKDPGIEKKLSNISVNQKKGDFCHDMTCCLLWLLTESCIYVG